MTGKNPMRVGSLYELEIFRAGAKTAAKTEISSGARGRPRLPKLAIMPPSTPSATARSWSFSAASSRLGLLRAALLADLLRLSALAGLWA